MINTSIASEHICFGCLVKFWLNVFCHFSLLTQRLQKCTINVLLYISHNRTIILFILSIYICMPIAVGRIGMATDKQLCIIKSLLSSLWLIPLKMWYHHDLHHNLCAILPGVMNCWFNYSKSIVSYHQYDLFAYLIIDFFCHLPNRRIFQTPTITHKSNVVAPTIRLPQLAYRK